MGLLDSIMGGGPPEQSGLSAATKALMLVLAAKAAKDFMANHAHGSAGAGAGAQGGPAQGSGAPAGGGGGLGGLLGGLLGGGAAPGASTPGAAAAAGGGGLASLLGGLGGGGGGGGGGGLGALLGSLGGAGALGALASQFERNGHGAAMNSWIGDGPNQPIAPNQLAQALGPQPLHELEAQTGLPQQSLLEQLAHELPAAISHLTPQGRLPTDAELASTAGAGQAG